MNSPTSRIAATALWWAWMPALAYLYWLVVHVLFGGVGTWDQWWRLDVVHRAWLPDGLNIWHATALFWIWVVVGLLGTAAIHSGVLSELADESFDGSSAEVAVGGAIAVVAVVVLAWQVPSALWDNDKVQGRYYNAATTFHITSMTNPPASTTYLVGGARKSSGPCDWRGDHDVPSCIKTGPLTGIQ
ncbi:MAG: hypothetical protein JWL97_4227, partial [Gemmatimonadales bacterium]|nr:hypothetical protein [Gemmatimonadales bacterium]